MTTLALAAAILRLSGHPDATGAPAVRARLLAVVVVEESARAGVDPFIVAAIIARESQFNQTAIGKRGELGLMQLLRGGAIPSGVYLSDAALMHPRRNIHLGCAYLAKMICACGGDVRAGLSRYNGGRCRNSRYAREVLRAAGMAQSPPEVARK
jgi:soluble lytic murein transglycosylase